MTKHILIALTALSLAVPSVGPAFAEESGTSGSTENQKSSLGHIQDGTAEKTETSETGISSHADTRGAPAKSAHSKKRAKKRVKRSAESSATTSTETSESR